MDLNILLSWLWKAAYSIHGEVDAARYKDYILPLVFYKRLDNVYADELTHVGKELGQELGGAEIFVEADRGLVRFCIPASARYQTLLRQEGLPVAQLRDNTERAADRITVSTMHMAKGLEYRAVFILQLQTLFQPDKPLTLDEQQTFKAEELRLLHVAMTRARDKLYMTYQSKLPAALHGMDSFLADARRNNAHSPR